MTINNPAAFCKGLWDWAILDGCFGGKIKPTDIEGLVERKGQFLLFETKAPNASIPDGQRYTLEALQKTGVFTIMIVWGETNQPERLEIWTHKGKKGPLDIDLAGFRDWVSRWYNWADDGGIW